MNFGGVVHINKIGLCVLIGVFILFMIYMYSGTNRIENVYNSKEINLNNLLNVAIRAAEIGGIEVVETKNNFTIKKKGMTKEGLIDSVTTADFLSHCAIVKTIKNYYSNLNIISEEADTNCDNYNNQKFNQPNQLSHHHFVFDDKMVHYKDVIIWIDPLDATYEYTEGLHQYVTTMVCVAIRGEPVIGVIHNPFTKETSWAWVHHGKSDDLKLVEHKKGLKIIISRSHSGDVREKLKNKLIDEEYEIIPAAGAGYKVLKVVTGAVDAYLHTTAIKKWDICAGNAILNAAGGKMTSINGKNIDYSDYKNVKENGLIATLKDHAKFYKLFN